MNVCQTSGILSPRPALSLEEEKELRQKTLRMHLILRGRDKRQVEAENFLSDVLHRLPQQEHNTEICAFCGESPQRAAISLTQCIKCNKVAYCSEGCRHSHAKVHQQANCHDETAVQL